MHNQRGAGRGWACASCANAREEQLHGIHRRVTKEEVGTEGVRGDRVSVTPIRVGGQRSVATFRQHL